MSKYTCRFTVLAAGPLPTDNPVVAGNAQCAAVSFWHQNTRNHPLPQTVTVIDDEKRYQYEIAVIREVVARPVGGKVLKIKGEN